MKRFNMKGTNKRVFILEQTRNDHCLLTTIRYG